jgi:hypothetical protein
MVWEFPVHTQLENSSLVTNLETDFDENRPLSQLATDLATTLNQ